MRGEEGVKVLRKKKNKHTNMAIPLGDFFSNHPSKTIEFKSGGYSIGVGGVGAGIWLGWG